MADDDRAAALDRIKGRGYHNGARGALCARLSDAAAVDVPLLVAAIERVLKLTASAKATGTTACLCADCDTARKNGFPSVHRLQPYMWDLDPAKLREAITTALAKGETP